MKILELKIMRGPNYWSIKHPKIIVLKLDLEDLQHVQTNEIPNLSHKVQKLFPQIYKHRSSAGTEGGFIKLLDEGTVLSKVVLHIALELQTMAGMNSGYGRRYANGMPGVETIVFSYQQERAGEYAAEAAVRITEALARGGKVSIIQDVARLHQIREDEYFGPTTEAILQEAVNRNIPYIQNKPSGQIHLGYGIYQKRIQAAMSNNTSFFAVESAGNKNMTKDILEEAGIPVPKGRTVYSLRELEEAIDELDYPIVTKPLDGNQGKGASINIQNWKDAARGFAEAQRFSQAVMVEQFIQGFDYRVLVINGKFVAAAKRTPAMVVGNGVSTIRQLINQVNKDPRRGVGHEKELTHIKVDRITRGILREKGISLQTILADGEELHLKKTANLSTGGTATDVTDIVDPYNVLMAERIAGIIGLDICGIDVMTSDIAIPLPDTRGAVIEVNAAPGLRMHISPTEGLPRNVAEPIIDMLFPHGCPSRIPIVAVTGTNGKTTTSRLISHILNFKGQKVGFTTTDGIYIQGKKIIKGDTTGSYSSEFVLKDPTVNQAVLEVARGGMLRSGLAFRQCDVGIVMNVSEDHLGLGDIHTVEEMAKVKAVVPKTVCTEGYAVLNADDDLVYEMATGLRCKIAFFSLDENNPRITEHISKGGLAAVFEDGYISIFKNTYKIRVDRVADVPLTFGGKARFNIYNVLAATLAAYISHMEINEIRTALRTFIPSPETTPGRMNLFKLPKAEVLIDYAHNMASMQAIGDFIKNTDAYPKIGIIAGVGDRRDQDMREVGKIAAEIFDEIIIRQDKDLRGRSGEEINNLLKEGIFSVKPELEPVEIKQEASALAYALEYAPQNAFIALFSEDISEAVKLVENFRIIQHREQNADK
ncbi:cyanophycin synthetase [Pontibacter sp. BT310]|uniref:Cyanophycin synthetase n=1 Tax=Pontibacter populi TaxID=890055 RepID=A0ABS6XEQ6_9BACT|nr:MULTISPECIES: cyanophycin synthetase [Pontibacter]MBJ6119601.1 cyanophycin synthetase [Pontibacter sp. BT310]MBR0572028.1 cyanophycin synthetase [Microvirga sp. STS03]MBW3366454.1 cyanophycin synthetase [Pontibacter populi]